MSCTPLPKAAKPVWAKQLTRLPCLVVYVKFQVGLQLFPCLGSAETIILFSMARLSQQGVFELNFGLNLKEHRSLEAQW